MAITSLAKGLSLTHPGLMLLSFKMMDRLIEYWGSQLIQWHLQKGLRVTDHGEWLDENTAFGNVNMDMVKVMTAYMLKRFSENVKSSIFCVSSFKV